MLVDSLPGVQALRNACTAWQRIPLPATVTGCLPDFLWAYAGTYFMASQGAAHDWTAWLPALLGLVHESGQAAAFFPGTFDWLDVFSYAGGALLARPGAASVLIHSFYHIRPCYPIHRVK